jgi:membrane protein YqaA with SNARE-associated domain
MKLFSVLYDRMLEWSAHRHAERYLAALSFAESSFFPIPPDVMLVPMTLAQPARGWRYAAITTAASVIGGAAGYAIGWFGIDAAIPLIERMGYLETYEMATQWFGRYGFLAILAAGFSPIPYKIFTIAGGALAMFFPGFVLASLLGRGARFFLVAGIIVYGGPRMEPLLRKYVDRIGWGLVVLILAAVLVWGLL